MNLFNAYLGKPHSSGCDCSVCAANRILQTPSPLDHSSPSTRCTQCRPTRVFTVVGIMSRVSGAWRLVSSTYRVERGYTCDKHTPARRPPQYWHVVYDSGRPTPFVPIHQPFEWEG
ncbi:hypothetical protein HNP46_006029 [Pseudomonas nitritireducens]|uniref:Uncharacterized protein n=1 Tax=Pseudomonas nitroreducens TaxID=46680 RepID=A0A7W7KR18_PSENT|nr:DUF5447 family protein [Pseudomonas nitritireducens]MBB4867121.1 hypothetical protein [Pseudomonas nitritireducens]